MFGGKILLAGYTTLVLLVLFSVNCYAWKIPHHCDPSSCGNIDNITPPFRLKGGPKNCGDKAYELECENNRTVLHLFSGKYYVEEIDYDNYAIRVVDVGIHNDDCSSLPLYSLTEYNFNYSDSPYHLRYAYGASLVVFMNCENPMKPPLYIENICSKGGGNSSGSVKGQYLYVVVGGDMKVSDVADLCTVEMMVPIAQSPLLMSGENRGNISISFLDVHNATAYGFELYFGNCQPHQSSFLCACIMEEAGLPSVDFRRGVRILLPAAPSGIVLDFVSELGAVWCATCWEIKDLIDQHTREGCNHNLPSHTPD